MRTRSQAIKEKSKPEPVPLFSYANKSPEASEAFDRVTERIFTVDILDSFDYVESKLKIGLQRTDYGTLLESLDEAEENARIAHKIYAAAKVERESWDIDAEVIKSAIWKAAKSSLEGDKAAGKLTKQITDADVRSECAALYPDEWKRLSIREKKYRMAEEHLQHLAELWKIRCKTLQTMISTLRK